MYSRMKASDWNNREAHFIVLRFFAFSCWIVVCSVFGIVILPKASSSALPFQYVYDSRRMRACALCTHIPIQQTHTHTQPRIWTKLLTQWAKFLSNDEWWSTFFVRFSSVFLFVLFISFTLFRFYCHNAKNENISLWWRILNRIPLFVLTRRCQDRSTPYRLNC